VTLTLRPEKLNVNAPGTALPAERCALKGTVHRRIYYGDAHFYEVDIGEVIVDVMVENRPGITRWGEGDEVLLDFHPEAAEALTE
jgi:ABC-type Fe3+/spermidine/putrescine transport system ATPase subunit